jgi:hypothetical protein
MTNGFNLSVFLSVAVHTRTHDHDPMVAEPRAEGGLLAPALNHSTFRRAWGVSCRATAQPAANRGRAGLAAAGVHRDGRRRISAAID